MKRLLMFALFFGICCPQSKADGNALKNELQQDLVGHVVISKIPLGGVGRVAGNGGVFPVNTLVYPGQSVVYRVEFGLIRGEVRYVQQQLGSGTSFRITGIDPKGDHLAIKLRTESGQSAELKLMLGTDWQSKLDLASVQSQIASVFVLDEPQAQTTQVSNTAPSAAAGFLAEAPSTPYQRDPNAPVIAGRISVTELQAVLSGFDAETQRALSPLSQDAAVLSRGLLLYQRAYSGSSNYASRYQLQAILQLQERLGKSIQPQHDDDVIEINNVFKTCARMSRFGQARDEQGNLYSNENNSQQFLQFVTSTSAVEVSGNVENDVTVERRQRAVIDQAKSAIMNVEGVLDKGDLVLASQSYQQLSSEAQIAQLPAVQQYLGDTAAFRRDLLTYAEANQINHRHDVALLEQIQNLGHETDLLKDSQVGPLTTKYLEDAIKDDTQAVRMEIGSLPTFQFNEASYRIPSGITESKELTFLSSHIKAIDDSLAKVSEVQAIIAQPGAMKTAEEVIGGNEAAALNATANQIGLAEHMRASLVDTQTSLQTKIAAEQEAERERVAAVEAKQRAEAQKEAAEEQKKQKLAAPDVAPDPFAKFEGRWEGMVCDSANESDDLAERITILPGPHLLIREYSNGTDDKFLGFSTLGKSGAKDGVEFKTPGNSGKATWTFWKQRNDTGGDFLTLYVTGLSSSGSAGGVFVQQGDDTEPLADYFTAKNNACNKLREAAAEQ